MDREDEAYVHEAFLADWRPGATNISSRFPKAVLQEKSPPIQPSLQEVSQVSEQCDRSRSGDTQTPISTELPAAVRYFQHRTTVASSTFTRFSDIILNI